MLDSGNSLKVFACGCLIIGLSACSTTSKPSYQSRTVHVSQDGLMRAKPSGGGYLYSFFRLEPDLKACQYYFKKMDAIRQNDDRSHIITTAHYTNFCATKYQSKRLSVKGSAKNKNIEVYDIEFRTKSGRNRYKRVVDLSKRVLGADSYNVWAYILPPAIKKEIVPRPIRAARRADYRRKKPRNTKCKLKRIYGTNVVVTRKACDDKL